MFLSVISSEFYIIPIMSEIYFYFIMKYNHKNAD